MNMQDSTPPAPLALLEVLERDGRVRRALAVQRWPVSIGRAIDNDLVLDDPHVAARHASLAEGEAGAALQVHESVNGAQLGKRRVAAHESAALPADGGFQLGNTRLRLRRPGDVLAAERPLARAARPWVTLVLALALWLWTLAEHAIVQDPGSKAGDWMVPLFGVPAAITAWCLLWAMASKLFQHRFDFWPHLAVAAFWLLMLELAEFVLPWLAAVSGVVLLSRLASLVGAACLVMLLLGHGRIVLPQQRRALAWLAGSGFVVGAAILMALNQQRIDRVFSELYVSQLPPPGLLWARPATQAEFVRGAAALRAPLEAAVKQAEAESRSASEGDDE
jgi:hypothetical protein